MDGMPTDMRDLPENSRTSELMVKSSEIDISGIASLHEPRHRIDRVREWLGDLCPGQGFKMERWVQRLKESDDPESRESSLVVRIYTRERRYQIKAVARFDGSDYLGCGMSLRAPLAGETHTRGRDLPDGSLTEETWLLILSAIIREELVRLETRPPGKTDESESRED